MRCQESIADHILPSRLIDDGFLWMIVPSFMHSQQETIQFNACKCMHAAVPAGEPKFFVLGDLMDNVDLNVQSWFVCH